MEKQFRALVCSYHFSFLATFVFTMLQQVILACNEGKICVRVFFYSMNAGNTYGHEKFCWYQVKGLEFVFKDWEHCLHKRDLHVQLQTGAVI
jgi:hypothetical protein